MLKRMQERYANVRDDAEVREALGFVPTEEERRFPDATPAQLSKVRADERAAGPGLFFCKLCPTKQIQSNTDLRLHLLSIGHKRQLSQYYLKNK